MAEPTAQPYDRATARELGVDGVRAQRAGAQPPASTVEPTARQPDDALLAELRSALAESRRQQAELRQALLAVVAVLDARSAGAG